MNCQRKHPFKLVYNENEKQTKNETTVTYGTSH